MVPRLRNRSTIWGMDCFRLFFLCLPFLKFATSVASSILCTELVMKRGYPCVDHNLTTLDGFHLTLQNIPFRSHSVKKNQEFAGVVFLQHGLLVGAESWVLSSDKQSLPFYLADHGFDVWMGNTRGSRWSTGHVVFTPSDKEYWDWTWTDMAAYDLPALLSYVYFSTGQKKMAYVGHSQGSLILLSALSGGPSGSEIQSMVSRAALLSPVAYLGQMTSRFCRTAARFFVDKVVSAVGVKEFNINSKLAAAITIATCAHHDVDCSRLLAAITGPNCCINMSYVDLYLRWMPSVTSVKNMAHFSQMIRSGKWQQFDYGPKNIFHYGMFSPPRFDARNVPSDIPLLLAYGGKDQISSVLDVNRLVDVLPSTTTQLLVPEYAHLDFLFSERIVEDVYVHLVPFLVSNSGSNMARD